jgi:alanyl-tRNA synthetase
MNIMRADGIRQVFFDFFRERGHAIVPSARLVPENDPTTLFTGSGMQPIVPYLLGEPHPSGTRIADSQKCFRSQDIEEVGDNRHTTFFEMLGNWSFGDYFKQEQITWMWEFLTRKIGLDPNRLLFTCFRGNDELGIPRDTESAEIWQKLFTEAGIDAKIGENPERDGIRAGERIFYYPEKKNWWSRSGIPSNMPEGEPGGPDTEMFWDFGAEYGLHERSQWKDEPCHVNCDCGRFMEIGNNVFMEYRKTASGFEKLSQQNVDFGGGLERIMAAKRNDPDMFSGDIFDGIREETERLSGKTYGSDPKETYAFRVVLDHVRAGTFLVGDGVLPSNTDQGYVLRRILRRAVRYSDMLGIPSRSLSSLSTAVIGTYSTAYPDLSEQQDTIIAEIAKEEAKFRETLSRGMKEFEKKRSSGNISGADAFDLFSTYGFPLEMTEELAAESGVSIDAEAFKDEFRKHQDLSRTASAGKFKGGLADHSEKVTMLHTATHLMLAGLRKYLGDHVHQAGSNITEERTRFDFTHPEKVSREVLEKVEAYVNEAIGKHCPMDMEQVSKTDAKARGVEGSFWEKYPEIVNVYSAKSDDGTVYSAELCGGPHVGNTGDIKGRFRIVKEEASSAGVRRIKAILDES